MPRDPVTSSFIKAVGYNPETREMEVEMSGGAVYTHKDVSRARYEEFINAPSLGAHYNAVHRGTGTRVGDETEEPDGKD